MGRVPDTVRTALNVLGIGLAVLAVVLAVLLAAPQAIGAEASYVVLSGSMAPTIQAGDVVVVGPADAPDIETGDVITFRDPDNPETSDRTDRVTHRVIEVRQTDDGVRFVTQGDANEDPDPQPVAPSQVIGSVWFHLPLVGYLVVFAQSPYGLVAFVIVPGVLLALSELYSLYTDALVIEGDEEEVEKTDDETEAELDSSGASHTGDPSGVSEAPSDDAEAFEWDITEADDDPGGGG